MHSLLRVEAGYNMAFTFVCFSESSSGACLPVVTSLVAYFCSSLLLSIFIYPGYCSHSSVQHHTSTVLIWKKPSSSLVVACLKMYKSFLAVQPVTTQFISLLFSSVPSSLPPGDHHFWEEAGLLSLPLLLQNHHS